MARIQERLGIDLTRRGTALARRMNIQRRYLSRDFSARLEGTREGEGNPDLAARAVRAALAQAGLCPADLAYLIGHTTTPAEPLPSNITRVAALLGYRGPVAEFRQACTGFLNATLLAAGLCAGGGGRPVAVVGSETGSVFFDPARAEHDLSQLVNFVQMGDGAGAIIFTGEQTGTRTARISRVHHGRLEAELPPGLRLRTGRFAGPASNRRGRGAGIRARAGTRAHPRPGPLRLGIGGSARAGRGPRRHQPRSPPPGQRPHGRITRTAPT